MPNTQDMHTRNRPFRLISPFLMRPDSAIFIRVGNDVWFILQCKATSSCWSVSKISGCTIWCNCSWLRFGSSDMYCSTVTGTLATSGSWVRAGSAYPEKGQKMTSQLLIMLRRSTLGHTKALFLVSQKTKGNKKLTSGLFFIKRYLVKMQRFSWSFIEYCAFSGNIHAHKAHSCDSETIVTNILTSGFFIKR